MTADAQAWLRELIRTAIEQARSDHSISPDREIRPYVIGYLMAHAGFDAAERRRLLASIEGRQWGGN